MFSSKNKEIKDLLETLLQKEIERKINKNENDTTMLHNGQTIINIDHSLSSYALLYLLLGQHSTTGSKDVEENSNFTTKSKLEEISEDITQMQEINKKFYLEVLETLR
ncbi:hypothetical protein [Peribacillus loiseleuriae]|uniref:Uncharacterized protein n=1 Tax=Peribacillus loiseleuriae TaxID=1679170 RepID=A0A0K9GXD0_9BACI|nr:hypothetical protein [Peribacillus loiseleuriae]KMY51290.1 hypothetical protein AC625_18500 [Peribacillus loiseleuriae]